MLRVTLPDALAPGKVAAMFSVCLHGFSGVEPLARRINLDQGLTKELMANPEIIVDAREFDTSRVPAVSATSQLIPLLRERSLVAETRPGIISIC